MRTGRPKAELVLTDDERAQLHVVCAQSLAAGGVEHAGAHRSEQRRWRAQQSIAERLKLTKATVGKWRTRFIERRIAGLYDDVRPGPPRTHRRRARGQLDQDDAAHQAGQWLDALERALGGRRDRHLQEQRAALLPALRPAAAPHRELQAVQRSVLRREAARRGRPVPEPAGQRAGALRGREEPVPGAGAHPADAAHGLRLCRGRHARLQAPRHDHAVRCAERAQRRGAGRVQAASSASGVPVVPARDRQGRARRLGRSLHRRQLRHAQPSEGQGLAGQRDRAGTCTSSRPTAPGSIRSSASSR